MKLFGSSVLLWIVALAALIVGPPIFRLALRFAQVRARAFADRRSSRLVHHVADLLQQVKLIALFAVALALSLSLLTLPPPIEQVLGVAVAAALIAQAAIFASAIAGFAVRGWFEADGLQPEETTVIHTLSFLASLIIWALAALVLLDNVGIDVTALLAGLGVGGIAVALALQNVLGDLFASLSIVLDKPFVVGDFIVVDESMGSVEHIGLKTTRLRSLSGEQLVFSNGDLLASRVRNFKRMSERRVVLNLGVVYETPQAKLEKIPELLRAAIAAQESTRFDRAHFFQLGGSSLDFEAVFYVLSADYNVYMDIRQRILLHIFESFAQDGIGFAYPTQTLYLATAA